MTTSDIVVREPENGVARREWIDLMGPALELAKHVVDTEFVPRGLRGNGAGIVAAILYGDELGLGPMQSLAKIAVIDGRPSLSAEAQRALILAAGHEIRLDESTVTRATLSGRRVGSDQWSTVTWNLDDARRAGLAGKPNWRSYPRQMLIARATADLARLLFADVVGGLAATEEIDDVDPLAGDPVGEVATKKTTRRRRQSAAVAVAAETGAGEQGEATPSDTSALPPLPDEPADSLVESGDVSTPSPGPDGGEPGPDATPETDGGTDSEASSSVSDPPSEIPLEPADDDPTEPQLKALDTLVGTLREAEVEVEGVATRVLSPEQLWASAARRRNVDVDVMIELLGGRDEAGVLHWSPLRDNLRKGEASDLIDLLSDRARRWGVS